MSQFGGGRRRASRRILNNVYLTLAILVLAVLIQATLTARIRVFGVTPDLLLTVVVSWSLLRGFTEGVIWGFLGGLALDAVTGMPLGTSSLALMPVCFLAGLGKSNIFAGNLLLPVIVVGLATPMHGWIVLLTEQLRGVPVDWLTSTVRVVAPELLLNGLAITVVYPILRGLVESTGIGRVEL